MSLNMSGIDKAFGANKVLKGVDFCAGRRRDSRADRRKRRGQNHADEHPGRRAAARRGRDPSWMAKRVRICEPARFAGRGRCVHPPGAEPGERPERVRKPVSRAGARSRARVYGHSAAMRERSARGARADGHGAGSLRHGARAGRFLQADGGDRPRAVV